MPDAVEEVDLTSEPRGEEGLTIPEVVDVEVAEPLDPGTAQSVDLTTEPPLAEGLTQPDAIAADREKYRGRLAIFSLALLSGLLVAAYVGVITKRVSSPDTKDFLAITLPAVTALTGGAVAFYFGSEHSGKH